MTRGCEQLCLEECLSVLEAQGHVKPEDTVEMLNQEPALPSLLTEARAFFLKDYFDWHNKTLDGLELMDKIKIRLLDFELRRTTCDVNARFNVRDEMPSVMKYCPKLFLLWLKSDISETA